MDRWAPGVFTSMGAGQGVALDVARELGISTIQLHAPHKATRDALRAEDLINELNDFGLTLTAVFGGFEGESYADIPTVGRTVGLVPRETRTERLAETKEIADFARGLGCNVVGLHLGFVPHDSSLGLYREVLDITRELCDYCQSNGQSLHLETGQEPAEVLLKFLQSVERDNLFVNFDPANMILYGAGDPLTALEILGPYVRSVHCKDAKAAINPGQEWGQEVPLGHGDVGIEAYLQTLQRIDYAGPLTIERELPHDPQRQRAEIADAVGLLTKLTRQLLLGN